MDWICICLEASSQIYWSPEYVAALCMVRHVRPRRAMAAASKGNNSDDDSIGVFHSQLTSLPRDMTSSRRGKCVRVLPSYRIFRHDELLPKAVKRTV